MMKGPNGEVVMADVMKTQETASAEMPVSYTISKIPTICSQVAIPYFFNVICDIMVCHNSYRNYKIKMNTELN